MSKYLLRVKNRHYQDGSSQEPPNERRRQIRFTDPIEQSPPPPAYSGTVGREQFLRDWPHPQPWTAASAAGDFCDPFPLFQPSIARYFNEDDRPLIGLPRRKDFTGGGDAFGDFDKADDPAKGESTESGQFLVDKRYVYTSKGYIKDFYCLFRRSSVVVGPGGENEEGEDLDLPDEVNRQILRAMAGGAVGDAASSKLTESATPSGEADGWDEDEHTPIYWAQRGREVDFFVRHDVWSVDPIGDWSHLNRNKVPRDFLRKLRRYFEIRPMEYLNDTGSYRMFHALNQYNDLRRVIDGSTSMAAKAVEAVKNWTVGCCGRYSTVDQARQMELDYLAMIWLSIWDPRLRENISQLKEMSMSDFFFTRVGWSGAVGVTDLLTKNEIHSMDDFWERRAGRQEDDEEDEGDFEELENWITGEAADEDGDSRQTQSGLSGTESQN
ncbi:hypothetical protein BV898_09828 [Hypsibius exemplaris]|uniref:Uncharacterized protein n=1 Tax=Hypsibius exemplaris TaxID=2072580 RepID=A0A1W0WLH7_HYPEX|nr:hypothetical protein BV898_09828 [Hypsibius exemplaris]